MAADIVHGIEKAIAGKIKRPINKDHFDGRFMMYSPYSGIPINRLGDQEYIKARHKIYIEKLEEAWQEHLGEVRRHNEPVYEASGLTVAREQEDRIANHMAGLLGEIADIRPDSAVGLAVKVRYLGGPDELGDFMQNALYADIIDMAGGIAS